ncbi:MAG: ABC transporter, permease protein 1 (cluster 4, leucine/isoleucine/valine/benzoate) [uncultured Paraburkholderia sp.]|nr:MAG: ABC transporter, permease protein 1 (cluster 4, leucine/isoleucine/valine/benzoate) [uncultured Paraburkholderia sp.]
MTLQDEEVWIYQLSIAAILAQDGITTGAIYALLALVLVFSVTRVIFIPQGEFVSYGALTLAALQTQKFPATCWLLMAMGAACFVVEVAGLARHAERRRHAARTLAVLAGKYLLFPVAVYALTKGVFLQPLPMIAQIALTLLIVIPMGPFVYRLAYEPIAEATFNLGSLSISGQSLWVVGTAVVLIGALYLYFDRSISGKALRATSVNRLGARLVGIGTTQAGRLAFTLAAGLGALCGILVAPR